MSGPVDRGGWYAHDPRPDPEDDNGGLGWGVGVATCQLCGYEHIAVWPETVPPTALECPSCGSRAAMPEPMEVDDAD